MARKRIPLADRNFIYWLHNYECANCQSTDNLEVDHIVPLANGGEDHVQNMQCLCSKCNLRKSDTHDGVFVYDELKSNSVAGYAVLEYILGDKNKANSLLQLVKQ